VLGNNDQIILFVGVFQPETDRGQKRKGIQDKHLKNEGTIPFQGTGYSVVAFGDMSSWWLGLWVSLAALLGTGAGNLRICRGNLLAWSLHLPGRNVCNLQQYSMCIMSRRKVVFIFG